MKKILITGSKGYIGTVLYEYLHNKGHKVTGVDNGSFEECTLGPAKKQIVTYKNTASLSTADIAQSDVVIHLSGLQNDPLNETYPGKLYDIEYNYSLKIAEICKQGSIKFIYASSCSVYGFSESETRLDENSFANPLTPYAKNKLNTEKALIAMADSSFKPVILRFATLFGYSPRMRFDLYINMFVGMSLANNKIVLNSDGTSWRPNVHINDVCKVLSLVIDKEFAEYSVINVGNNNLNARVTDLVEILKDLNPKLEIDQISAKDELFKDQYVVGKKDLRSYQVDFTKLNTLFGGEVCGTSFSEGIQDMILKFQRMDNFSKMFKDPKFYRLQWMKHLMTNSRLDSELNFKQKH